MADVSKINGYNLKDANAREELNNKADKEHTHEEYAESSALESKQDKLVSGSNIKTINGKSVLGSGNINIASGGSTGDAINYDLNVKAVNHRGYSIEAPENTLPAYIKSKEMGFTYVECDVSFTADNVAVLLHDSTIDRTSDGTGNITSLTYSKLLTYDFGSWFSNEYIGVKIPTFKEFIILCKNLGLHPYIELKNNGGYTQDQITQIVNEVKECGMKGKVTYISFSNSYLTYVKNADSSARLGYLISTLTSGAITGAKNLRTGTNEVFMDLKLANLKQSHVDMCMEAELPLEVWTVNTEEEIKNMFPYISGVTSDNLVAGKILYEKSLTYAPPQAEYVPATSITLDKTSIMFEDLTPQTITATITPSNSTESAVWKSSNTNAATVSNGVVTPVKNGTCIITATAGSVSATCNVEVDIANEIFVITKNLKYCKGSSSATSVLEKTSYSETFTANTGYTLDGATVTVTMAGVDISNCYNNGTLTIASVTGDIVINVTAKEKTKYSITRKLVGCTTSSTVANVIENEAHSETFTANTGYLLEGATVSITMGETDVSSYYSNGTLNIPSVTGDIVVNIVAKEKEAVKYSITRNLTNCTSSSSVTEIIEAESHTETFTPNIEYSLLSSNISITMGGVDITSCYNNRTLTIPAVTGDIVINIEGVKLTSPLIDYAFSSDGTHGVLTNTGTGGATYDIQTVGSYNVTDDKLSLLNGAYASVDYPTTRTGKFTIRLRVSMDALLNNKYERLFRTNTDALCAYYSQSASEIGCKLSNVKNANGMVHNDNIFSWSPSGVNTGYFKNNSNEVGTMHDYVYTGDGTTIKLYFDGILIASQDQNALTEGTSYAIGNADSTTTATAKAYNANITVEKWQIFDYAMNDEEVYELVKY